MRRDVQNVVLACQQYVVSEIAWLTIMYLLSIHMIHFI